MTATITRRSNLGLGATPNGGNAGSFAAPVREQAAALPTPDTDPRLDDHVLTLLEGGAGPDAFDGTSMYEDLRAAAQQPGFIDRELIFVDRDERLSPEDIDAYLSGDRDEELYTKTLDSYTDRRWERSEELAREMLTDMGVQQIHSVDHSVLDEVSEIIRDYDTSDPIPQLVRNTPPQLMRAPLGAHDLTDSAVMDAWLQQNEYGYTLDDVLYDSSENYAEARTDYLAHYLRAEAGISELSEEDAEALRDLATEGPWQWHEGVRLDAIWYGDIQDAAIPSTGTPTKTLTFGGAPAHSRENQDGKVSIVLLDTVNGSGYDAQLGQPVTIHLTDQRPAMLDSGGSSHGYGWDDSAGVYKPAYGVSVAVTSADAEVTA